MSDHRTTPGVTRENRISDEGLQRLDRQLARGGKITLPVLAQWVRRYGDSARDIIRQYGYNIDDLDQI